jgi:hypothetical protein
MSKHSGMVLGTVSSTSSKEAASLSCGDIIASFPAVWSAQRRIRCFGLGFRLLCPTPSSFCSLHLPIVLVSYRRPESDLAAAPSPSLDVLLTRNSNVCRVFPDASDTPKKSPVVHAVATPL